MKNYQKILFPCAAALVLSLSAFISAHESSSLESLKEQSVAETGLLSARGSDSADSHIVIGTTTNYQKEVVLTSIAKESNVSITLMDSKILDIRSIVESYK